MHNIWDDARERNKKADANDAHRRLESSLKYLRSKFPSLSISANRKGRIYTRFTTSKGKVISVFLKPYGGNMYVDNDFTIAMSWKRGLKWKSERIYPGAWEGEKDLISEMTRKIDG